MLNRTEERSMRTRAVAIRCALLMFAFSFVAYIVDARFPQPHEEYQARRAKLRTAVDGPIVLYSFTGNEDASEVAVFFQEPNFYYLTGHSEPGAALVLIPDPPAGKQHESSREILYLPARNLGQEKWEGPKLGPADPDAAAKTGFESVRPLASLKGDLEKLAKAYSTFYTVLPPQHEEGYPHFTESATKIRAAIPNAALKDIEPTLSAMRQVKSAGELALLQKAIDLSVDSHLDAIRQMRPGLFEYQIAARMKQIHEWGGCAREAYAPIVGTGFNSTVLHYSALDAEIKDGDVVVIDVGGEYGGYAADITRTLPAGGKFTPRQREIYEIVLGAQNAAIAAVKPGAKLFDGPESAMQVSYKYINSHGQDKEGKPLGKYYIHGVSHHLGLDVHDPGDRDRPLEPGMVVTVEPGIYIPEENLGVRIEDDVLITKDGNQILSARLPRTADEIEKLMAEARANSQP
jgi:Xaa-Pro aminopeptidase